MKSYTFDGDDPFIVYLYPADERVPADQRVHFSAWDYAYERTQAMTSHGKAREIGDAGSVTETNPDVIEQSKATRAKDALDALRSGEPPLGSLTSEEQSWLATACAHLNRIYEKLEAGRPGNNAVCVFDVGNVYVQFLAPWDAELLVCEAVSAKFVPEIAAVLTTGEARSCADWGSRHRKFPLIIPRR